MRREMAWICLGFGRNDVFALIYFHVLDYVDVAYTRQYAVFCSDDQTSIVYLSSETGKFRKNEVDQFDFWGSYTTHVIVESVQYHTCLDLYRWKIIRINQTKQQINIWHVDGIDHIKKYESIDESPGNASLTTEWHSRSACTYIFYRIQKPLPT